MPASEHARDPRSGALLEVAEQEPPGGPAPKADGAAAKYQALIQTTGTGYVILDLQGRVLDANDEYVRLSGHAGLDQILGRSVVEWTAEHDRERNAAEVAKCLKDGCVRQLELDYVDGAGRLTPIEINATVVPSESGATVLTLCRDITERRRRETALKQSTEALRRGEELLRRIFEASPSGLALVGRDGRIVRCNEAVCQLFGYTRDELAQRSLEDMTHPEDLQAATGTARRYLRKDGGVVWSEASLTPLRDDQGRPQFRLVVLQDVTEKRRLQQRIEGISALRESLLRPGDLPARLRTVTDFLVDAFAADFARIWIARPGDLCQQGCVHASAPEGRHACRSRDRCLHLVASSGRYTHTDGQAHRRVPYGAYKIGRVAAGHEPRFVTNDVAHDPRVHNHDWAVGLGLAAFAGYRLVSEQGEPIGVMALFSKQPLSDEVCALLGEVAATASEVILASRVEEARKALELQLLQAQKMESVGRLAGGVAHDFNNMLQVILGHGELAQREPMTPGLRDKLAEIRRAAGRSAELTRQLLAFARRQTIQPKVIDLNDVVSAMLRMLGRLIGEQIALTWLPAPGLWRVKVDPGQVEQCLTNLALNARDAIAGTGQLTIETANVTLDEGAVRGFPGCEPGDHVLLSVTDSGSGMDEATRAHIFEPFYSTKPLGKGTGLGLATVFGIVSQNHGLIEVDTRPGRGTRMRLYLPRSCEADGEGTDSEAAPAVRGSETILLVEDEEQVLSLTRDVLAGCGYRVLTASNPQAALALEAGEAACIDLLLTDVVMPGMNGRELWERLAVRRPSLKCLFISGYTADVIAGHGVADEGATFLQKPFTFQGLLEQVKAVLNATAVQPAVTRTSR